MFYAQSMKMEPESGEDGEHEGGHPAACHEEGHVVRLQPVGQVHTEYTWTPFLQRLCIFNFLFDLLPS